MEVILDEINTEALWRKLMAEPQAITSPSWKLIPSALNPHVALFKFRIGSKMEEVITRLKQIVTEKDDLELRENVGARSSGWRERMPKTSLVDECYVYGREMDKEAILELLLKAEVSDNTICMIPIVGMGGIGKATLAQLFFSNSRVNECFDLTVWICVSQEFNAVKVRRSILQAITLQSIGKGI